MQDLIKSTTPPDVSASVTPNAFGGIYDKRAPKKTFIELRKNKTNFWNLMFALGFILGMGLVLIIAPKAPAPFPLSAIILFWTTLIGVPLLVKYFSKVTYSDGKFFNIEGIELDIPNQLPNGFFLIVTPILMAISLGAISDKFVEKSSMLINFLFIPSLLIVVFFIPVLFFILKNCPVSILFNYQFYKQNIKFSNSYNFEHNKPLHISNTPVHWTIDPTKSGISGNVFHHNHTKY